MTTQETADLRALPRAGLLEEREESHRALFNLRFQAATRQLADVSQVRGARRRIARIETLLREREILVEMGVSIEDEPPVAAAEEPPPEAAAEEEAPVAEDESDEEAADDAADGEAAAGENTEEDEDADEAADDEQAADEEETADEDAIGEGRE